MKIGPLGKLEIVKLRDVWPTEAGDFTPWLARDENLALLGEAIGIELQCEGREQNVGPYRADIVCKDSSDDSWVLVENQLDGTDHTHLGQILTYAAGLGAVTIVWIAKRFTDEHRATLEWLNEISGENIQFFGLEVEAWRIGASDPAPRFNLAVKPNGWTKGVKSSSGELSETKKFQLDFWRGFDEHVQEHGVKVRPGKASPRHWMNIGIGCTGFRLAAVASLWDSSGAGYGRQELRAELVMYDSERASEYYAALFDQREQLHEELGEPLIWYNADGVKSSKVYLQHRTDLHDISARESQYGWLLEKLEKLHGVFAARVSALARRAWDEAA